MGSREDHLKLTEALIAPRLGSQKAQISSHKSYELTNLTMLIKCSLKGSKDLIKAYNRKTGALNVAY